MKSKIVKPKFRTEIIARFSEPDKKDKVLIEMEIKNGDSTHLYSGNIKRLRKNKVKIK